MFGTSLLGRNIASLKLILTLNTQKARPTEGKNVSTIGPEIFMSMIQREACNVTFVREVKFACPLTPQTITVVLPQHIDSTGNILLTFSSVMLG
jgi:hypothetical protein